MHQREIALASVAVLAAVLASTACTGSSATTDTAGPSCKDTLKIAVVSPFTGGGANIGNEQGRWARYAVKTLAPNYGLKIKLIMGDTPVEQGVASAIKLAQQYGSDRSVVAVIGPATSRVVGATSKVYFDAGIAHISSSATRSSLTKGPVKEATTAFFRVVGDDSLQGPTDANFMIKKDAKKVVLFDFQEPYSLGLTQATEAVLKAKGIATTRLSVANTVTDFSSAVSRIASNTHFVFVPTQKPGDAQKIARKLIEQGKKAKVFGGDGTDDPSQFKVPGSYVSTFAPDIRAIAYNKALIAGWQKDNPGAVLGSFGPPAYLATQVALNAIKRACDIGKGRIDDRRDVIRNVKQILVKNAIIGGDFRFSPVSNDPVRAKYYIFEIQKNGSYKTVD